MARKRSPSAPRPETDAHYTLGFLYAMLNRDAAAVGLGRRITDVESMSQRDVDIVIVSHADGVMAGIELKDKTRRLTQDAVEGLCCKLRGMPSLKERVIVSTSGFSGTAIRKARAHGVECLRLTRGPIPKELNASDLSPLDAITERGFLNPHLEIVACEPATVDPLAAAPITLEQLAPRIFRPLLKDWPLPDGVKGQQVVQLADRPRVRMPGGQVVILSTVAVIGHVGTVRSLPILAECFLADLQGTPYAGAKLFEQDGDLWAIGVPRGSLQPSIVRIPKVQRVQRPIEFRM